MEVTSSTTTNGQATKARINRRSYKSELKLSEARERKWFLTAIAASSLAFMEAVVYWVIELTK